MTEIGLVDACNIDFEVSDSVAEKTVVVLGPT